MKGLYGLATMMHEIIGNTATQEAGRDEYVCMYVCIHMYVYKDHERKTHSPSL